MVKKTILHLLINIQFIKSVIEIVSVNRTCINRRIEKSDVVASAEVSTRHSVTEHILRLSIKNLHGLYLTRD